MTELDDIRWWIVNSFSQPKLQNGKQCISFGWTHKFEQLVVTDTGMK